MDYLHVDRLEELHAALELMEPFGMASKSDDCPQSLAVSVAEYRRLRAEHSVSYLRAEFGNLTCGEAIYGCGGVHRYYLKIDGYIYFSAHHAGSKAIRDAEALGFRIN